MKLIFRTNAGSEGLGHINRVYALYIAIKQVTMNNLESVFIVNREAYNILIDLDIDIDCIYISDYYDENDLKIYDKLSPDGIIIDSYKASSEYIKSIKNSINTKIILFDDNNLIYRDIYVDVLINGNLYAKKLDYRGNINYKLKLVGAEYLIMNPIYWETKRYNDIDSKSLLITVGGADPFGTMPKLVEWTRNLDIKKDIVIGPYFDKNIVDKIYAIVDKNYCIIEKKVGLREYIERNKIILTASGSTVYEALSLNKIPLIFIMGDDQILISNELEKYGVINLGVCSDITEESLNKNLKSIMEEDYYVKLEPLFKIFDGKGAIRVTEKIKDYIGFI